MVNIPGNRLGCPEAFLVQSLSPGCLSSEYFPLFLTAGRCGKKAPLSSRLEGNDGWGTEASSTEHFSASLCRHCLTQSWVSKFSDHVWKRKGDIWDRSLSSPAVSSPSNIRVRRGRDVGWHRAVTGEAFESCVTNHWCSLRHLGPSTQPRICSQWWANKRCRWCSMSSSSPSATHWESRCRVGLWSINTRSEWLQKFQN